MEDCYMGKATERMFLPLVKMQMPEIVDMNLPLERSLSQLCLNFNQEIISDGMPGR